MATGKKPGRAKQSREKEDVNKAEAIRQAAKELGGNKVRPRDVIAALAVKGITVSSPQVSSTLKAAGFRRVRRGKARGSQARASTNARAGISLDELLAAKALIGKTGSVDAAKKALDAIAKLV